MHAVHWQLRESGIWAAGVIGTTMRGWRGGRTLVAEWELRDLLDAEALAVARDEVLGVRHLQPHRAARETWPTARPRANPTVSVDI